MLNRQKEIDLVSQKSTFILNTRQLSLFDKHIF